MKTEDNFTTGVLLPITVIAIAVLPWAAVSKSALALMGETDFLLFDFIIGATGALLNAVIFYASAYASVAALEFLGSLSRRPS
jgi:hypothetical protein